MTVLDKRNGNIYKKKAVQREILIYSYIYSVTRKINKLSILYPLSASYYFFLPAPFLPTAKVLLDF